MTHIDFSREKETPSDTAMQIICTVNHKKTNSLKNIKCKQSAEIVTRKINQLFRKHSWYSDVLVDHESQKVFFVLFLKWSLKSNAGLRSDINFIHIE